MSVFGWAHATYIYPRRIQRLSELLSEFIPIGYHILDIGCGDGKLALSLQEKRPDLQIQGLDVQRRQRTWLPVTVFDGTNIPFTEASFDAVMLIDVLHHTNEPLKLLQEALRVSRHYLLIKDHVLHGPAARLRLRLMDWLGNSRHGVALPYNYLSEGEWSAMRHELGVEVTAETRQLALYSGLTNLFFGAGLHFIAVWRRVGVAPDQKDIYLDSATKLFGP